MDIISHWKDKAGQVYELSSLTSNTCIDRRSRVQYLCSTERQAERLYVLKKADLTFTPPGQEIMSRRRNKQGEFASFKQDQWKTALKREGDL